MKLWDLKVDIKSNLREKADAYKKAQIIGFSTKNSSYWKEHTSADSLRLPIILEVPR